MQTARGTQGREAGSCPAAHDPSHIKGASRNLRRCHRRGSRRKFCKVRGAGLGAGTCPDRKDRHMAEKRRRKSKGDAGGGGETAEASAERSGGESEQLEAEQPTEEAAETARLAAEAPY